MLSNSKKFNKDIEQNTPIYTDTYKGLSQPLEDKIIFYDELLGTQIDFKTWKIPKERIFEIINQETGEAEKEFIPLYDSVYNQIQVHKKLSEFTLQLKEKKQNKKEEANKKVIKSLRNETFPGINEIGFRAIIKKEDLK